MQQEHKNNQHLNLHKVLHVIEYFPGFVGYSGGGAERLLERLITGHKSFYPEEYHPTLYVANEKEKCNQYVYPFVTIEDPGKTKMEAIITGHNDAHTILHLGNTFLIARHPELFQKIGEMWQGPIIQRVTLTSKIIDIFDQYQEKGAEYLSHIDVFISQSDQMTRELLVLGIPLHKVAQIENGIDTSIKLPTTLEDKQQLRKELFPWLKPDSILFLFVGRLGDQVKKVDELLVAWEASGLGVRGHCLILAGNYDATDVRFSAYLNREQNGVVFTGHLEEREIEKYFQVVDVFVSASEREGFSNSVLEAMSYALPVLVREGVSGYEHLVIPNKNGLLFCSTQELTKKMSLLASNMSLRKELGTCGRIHVTENYSIQRMVEKYRQLYNSLLIGQES